MKMVWHKTITKNFCTSCQLLTYFFYKEDIIAVVEEYSLFVIAPVVNVITFILYEVHKGLFYDGLRGPERYRGLNLVNVHWRTPSLI